MEPAQRSSYIDRGDKLELWGVGGVGERITYDGRCAHLPLFCCPTCLPAKGKNEKNGNSVYCVSKGCVTGESRAEKVKLKKVVEGGVSSHERREGV